MPIEPGYFFLPQPTSRMRGLEISWHGWTRLGDGLCGLRAHFLRPPIHIIGVHSPAVSSTSSPTDSHCSHGFIGPDGAALPGIEITQADEWDFEFCRFFIAIAIAVWKSRFQHEAA